MIEIKEMVLLGVIAGFVAIFWTRIIRKNMIFTRLGKYLERVSNNSWIMNQRESPWAKFIRCAFCLTPWLVFAFEMFYVITYHPPFICALIGVIGGLGAGNFVCEIVNAFRNEDV
jgi:hypothetical protein